MWGSIDKDTLIKLRLCLQAQDGKLHHMPNRFLMGYFFQVTLLPETIDV